MLLSENQSPVQTNRILLAGITAAIIYQVIMLIFAGWQNRDVLKPDAVCYIRIATYYASGQFDLAVTGYWGPMLSWLIAPLLGLVENPLYAARIVMGLSAVIFLLGCISIFRSMEIHPAGILVGAWITAVMSVAWSVAAITPDLLMSGLMCMAISQMLSRQWVESRSTQVAVGALWGATYLAKAVAFPLAFLIGMAITSLWVIGRLQARREVLQSFAITLLGFLSVASIWILPLSLKYGGLVFSTSGKIAHAIVGPQRTLPYHPTSRIFHRPEPGRITSGEDPINMPYHYWSPFDSLASAKYQVRLIQENVKIVLDNLSGFTYGHIGLFAVFCGLLVHTPWRQNMGTQRWRWAGVIVAIVAGVYLPVYANDQRYYYVAYPFLFAASIGFIEWLTRPSGKGLSLPRCIGLGAVTLCFALPAYTAFKNTSSNVWGRYQTQYAYTLAKKLRETGVQGPIAGGSNKGLYTAFFTEQPWYGDEPEPTAERFKASRAKLAFVPRYQLLADTLDQDPAFANLDSVLFKNKEEADKFPLKVYQILQR